MLCSHDAVLSITATPEADAASKEAASYKVSDLQSVPNLMHLAHIAKKGKRCICV